MKIKYNKTRRALEDELCLRKPKKHKHFGLSRLGYELWYIIKKDLRMQCTKFEGGQ